MLFRWVKGSWQGKSEPYTGMLILTVPAALLVVDIYRMLMGLFEGLPGQGLSSIPHLLP
jgi:hypothetical protein